MKYPEARCAEALHILLVSPELLALPWAFLSCVLVWGPESLRCKAFLSPGLAWCCMLGWLWRDWTKGRAPVSNLDSIPWFRVCLGQLCSTPPQPLHFAAGYQGSPSAHLSLIKNATNHLLERKPLRGAACRRHHSFTPLNFNWKLIFRIKPRPVNPSCCWWQWWWRGWGHGKPLGSRGSGVRDSGVGQNLGQPFREDEDTEAVVHRGREEQSWKLERQGQRCSGSPV